MTGPVYEDKAREWLSAWNSHDLERIVAHYSEDVEFESPFVAKIAGEPSGKIRGKAALKEYFRKALEAYPKLRFGKARVFSGASGFVLRYESVNGLEAAEAFVLNPSGSIVRATCHYSSEKP